MSQSSKLVSITPERPDNIISKILRFFHLRGFNTTFRTMLRVPITDLYHPGHEKLHSEYPTIAVKYRGLLGVSYEACTGCRKCERICPNNTIIMETRVINGKEHRFPGYLAARCMFCGLCEESCDRQFSIRHTDQFEDAGYSREQLYYGPERMWDMWDRHLQPKVDAGIAHKATPDKKREEYPEESKAEVPMLIPGYLEKKAEEAAAKAAKRAKRE